MATTVFDLQAVLGLDSSKYESGLNKAKGLAGTIGSGISSALKVGVAAVTAATTAVVGFGASAVKAGESFDKSMSQVAATMGKTMQDMENEVGSATINANGKIIEFEGTLRDFAIELGKNTAFSATEAADALNYMALAGYDTQQSMDMLPSVLSLAAAGNFDLARASDMVTDAQTAFQIDAKRTAQMVDEMAKASTSGNTSVEQLGDAFLVVGGLAQELNGGLVKLKNGTTASTDGVQELEIALTAMASAGVKGSEAGTHMRNMILKLSDPTDKGTLALKDMGVAIFDDEGKMKSLSEIFGDFSEAMDDMTQEEKLQKISALFNTRDIASAKSLLNAVTGEYVKMGDEIYTVEDAYSKWGDDIYDSAKGFEYVKTSWDNIGESILDAQGAAAKMADTQLDNLEGDIVRFKSALEGAKIAISDQVTPSLREFVQFGTDGIGRLTDAFKEGLGANNDLAAGLQNMMSEFGVILSEAISMITEKLPDFVTAGIQLISALGEGLMKNLDPIIDAGINIVGQIGQAIITGLPALIDAGLQIIEALLGAIADNIDAIMEAGKTLIEGIVTAVNEHGPEIMELGLFIIETLFNSLIDNLPQLMGFVTDMIVNLVTWISDNADQMIDSAIALIEALGQGLVENLPKIIEAAVELITTLVEALTDPTNLTMLLDVGLEILETLVQAVIDNLPALIEAAVQIILNLVEYISNNLDKVIQAAIDIIMAIAQALLENLPLLISAAIDIVVALAGALIENIPTVISAILQIIEGILTTLISSLPKMAENGVKIVESIIGGIVKMLGSIIEMGIKLVETFIDGIVGAGARIVETGKEMISKLGESILSVIDTAKQWGKDLIDNFVGGIKDKIQSVKDTVSDIASTIKDILGFSEPEEGPLSNFHTFAPDMMDLFIKGVRDNTGKLQSQIEKSFDFGSMISEPNMSFAMAREAGSQTNISNAVSGITINVYGTEGQDVKELADLVSDRLLHQIGQTGAVYA